MDKINNNKEKDKQQKKRKFFLMIQSRMFLNHLGGVSKGKRAKSAPSQRPSPG